MEAPPTTQVITDHVVLHKTGTEEQGCPATGTDGVGTDDQSTNGEGTDDEVVTTWGLVVEGFTATTQRLRADLDGELAIPLAWLDVLLRLLRTPGHRLGMSALAAHTAITTGGFTRMADRMSEAGLVRRDPCGADRRVVWITLTPVGLDLAGRARIAHARHLRDRVLDVLDPEETAALARAMRHLRDHAWSQDGSPSVAVSATDPCSAGTGRVDELTAAQL